MRKRIFTFFLVITLCVLSRFVPSAAQQEYFADWNKFLGSSEALQYSSLKQINKANVRQLEVAWTYATGDSEHYEFSPIVVKGTMYVLAKNNSLVALDAASGKELWVHSSLGKPASRGINYWQSRDTAERRLLMVDDGFLTAIDTRTGETIRSFGDNGLVSLRSDAERGYRPQISQRAQSNPGRVFEDLIIIPLPTDGYSYAAMPGDIHAYDVRTGKRMWVFHTIPHPGEFGYETWPEDAWKRSGGVANWGGMSIDEKRGIVYIPLSSPKFDFYGGDRKGANLFGNSLVALDARTGKRIWHFQVVHHDLWDWDLPSCPQLLTITHNGKAVDVVSQLTKHGFVFVFNRETGEPLWPIEERPAPKSDVPGEETYPTQPWPTKPPPYLRMSFTEKDINPFLPDAEKQSLRDRFRAARKSEGLFTPPSQLETFLMPGYDGSPGSAAADPTKGVVYIVTKEVPTAVKLQLPRLTVAGNEDFAKRVQLPTVSLAEKYLNFAPYMTNPVYDSLISPTTGLGAISPPWSRLVAIDLNDGTIKWERPQGTIAALAEQGYVDTGAWYPRGGPVVTAGGLIFVATSSDRMVRAYDQDNGTILWQHEIPNSSTGVPAVYEVDGRQYIAFPAASVGSSGLELPVTMPSRRKPGPGSYIAFALPKR
jgi:glucose dehydrogenase